VIFLLCVTLLSLQQFRVLLGKPLGRYHLEFLNVCRCEDNIKVGLYEIGWECVDWIYLAEGRSQWYTLTNRIINLQVP